MIQNVGGYTFIGSTYSSIWTKANLLPYGNATYQFGSSGNMWASAWVVGAVWNGSDRRYKTDIDYKSLGLDFINALKPTGYKRIGQDGDGTYYGFIAQDVAETVDAMGINFAGLHRPTKDDEKYALSYQDFIAPLVKAVQELKSDNDNLRAEIKAWEAGHAR